MKWHMKFLSLVIVIIFFSPNIHSIKNIELFKFLNVKTSEISDISDINRINGLNEVNGVSGIIKNKTGSIAKIYKEENSNFKNFLNVTNLKEEQKKLEIEEKILMKRKNDITELLKINLTNINLNPIDDDFEASYNTLKLINSHIHNLKNITYTNTALKSKKIKIEKNKTGKPILNQNESVNGIGGNENVNVNVNGNKFETGIKDEKTKSINSISLNTTFNKQNITTGINSKIIGINTIKNTTEENITKIITHINNNNNNNSLLNDSVLNSSVKEKTLTDYLESTAQLATPEIKITNNSESVIENAKFIKNNKTNEIDITSIDTSNLYNKVNSRSKPQKSKFLKTNEEDIIKPVLTAKSKDKDSLYTRMINISLSLILIGILMGVMFGLILVMYVKTLKDNKH